jgi:phosphate transport system permease protein
MTDLPGSPRETGLVSDPDGKGASEQPGGDPLAREFGEDFDPLAPSDNLRRRRMVDRLITSTQTAAALLAVAVLGVVVYSIASHAASVLSFSFLTHAPPSPNETSAPGGGVAPEIIGTAVIVAIATAMATPTGILIALYLTEFAGPRIRPVVRLALDLLYGVPSIILGLFVFGLLVAGHHQSGFAAAVGLAIIMLPLIARATQEVLLRVPAPQREAADALGMSHWRTVRGVVLPSARGGILTATILAVARAAGETAPLIFVSSLFAPDRIALNPFSHEGLPNIPVYIFTASEAAEHSGFARAWGAAFILLAFILVANIVGRAVDRRTTIISQ